MKKRDKRLELGKEFLNDTWRLFVGSVRQLKHDHKRNTRNEDKSVSITNF